MVDYKAPPGSWKQYIVLAIGAILLLIFAPTASSLSTQHRTKRIIFKIKAVGKNGINSSRISKNSSEDRQESRDSSVESMGSSEDPALWKQLKIRPNILSKELIEHSTIELKTHQQGIDSTGTVERGSSGQVEKIDQWYFLKESQLENNGSYEVKLTFPLETPLDIDLDILVWTFEGVEERMPVNTKLLDHFSKSDMFIRVQLTRMAESLKDIDGSGTSSCSTDTNTDNNSNSNSSSSNSSNSRSRRRRRIFSGGLAYSLQIERVYFQDQLTQSELRRIGIVSSGVCVAVVAVGAVVARVCSGG